MVDRHDEQRRIGVRVAQARTDAGLTQGALADRVGMERTQLVRVEAGDRRITVSELAAIAEDLGLSLEWFVIDSPPAVTSRRSDAARDPSSRALDLAIDRAARDVRFLLDRGVLQYRDRATVSVPQTFEQAERLAQQVRNLLDLEVEPISDLGGVAEQLGVIWFSERLGRDAGEGACVELLGDADTRIGVAVLNGSTEPGRRRWTLAHEVGHFLMGDAFAGDHPPGEIERYINAFVVHLLLPRGGVERIWRELPGATLRRRSMAVAARYMVSWSAACGQLRNLRLIDHGAFKRMVDDVPTRGEFVAAGEILGEELEPPAVPRTYERAVLAAYSARTIAHDRTLELLRGTYWREDLPPRSDVGEYPALGE
jgi:transcriptional regulator with XRE-family HTH domain